MLCKRRLRQHCAIRSDDLERERLYVIPRAEDKKVSVLVARDVDDWAVVQNQLTNEVKFVSLSPDGQLLSWDPTLVKKVRPFAEGLQGSPGNIGTVRGWAITAPRRDLTIAAGLAPLKSLIDPVALAPDYLGPPEGQCSCWPGALIGTHVRTTDMIYLVWPCETRTPRSRPSPACDHNSDDAVRRAFQVLPGL